MIRAIKSQTSKPFNVNVFVHADPAPDAARDAAWLEHLAPHFEKHGAAAPTALRTVYTSFNSSPDVLAVLVEEQVPIVSFHFGLPTAHAISALKAYGATLFATATSVAEAREVEAAGIDAIVAQGWEAGGHRGVFDATAPDDQLGLVALTRLLVREVTLPIIAAGGIMDGAGVRAALDLGAAAAQLGTAFIVTDESDADAGHKNALAGEAAFHTRIIPHVSGRPARALAGAWTDIALAAPPGVVAAYPNAYDAGKLLNAAAKATGETAYGAYWGGQGAPLVRPMKAAALVEVLVQEAGLGKSSL
jgi:nitronate monooxygenase